MLVLTTPLTSLADITGGGQAKNVPIKSSNDPGFVANHGIFQDYGFRVSFTTSHPIEEAGIRKLSGSYTLDDVTNQRVDIENISNTRYWESGDYGIYFYKHNNRGIKPNYGITSTSPSDRELLKELLL